MGFLYESTVSPKSDTGCGVPHSVPYRLCESICVKMKRGGETLMLTTTLDAQMRNVNDMHNPITPLPWIETDRIEWTEESLNLRIKEGERLLAKLEKVGAKDAWKLRKLLEEDLRRRREMQETMQPTTH